MKIYFPSPNKRDQTVFDFLLIRPIAVEFFFQEFLLVFDSFGREFSLAICLKKQLYQPMTIPLLYNLNHGFLLIIESFML